MTIRIGNPRFVIAPKYKLSDDFRQNGILRVARVKRERQMRASGEWKWDGKFTRKPEALALFDTMPPELQAEYYVAEQMPVYL